MLSQSVSPCAFRLSLSNWVHVPTRMRIGTAERDQLPAVCLLPCLAPGWIFDDLQQKGKNTQILFVALESTKE